MKPIVTKVVLLLVLNVLGLTLTAQKSTVTQPMSELEQALDSFLVNWVDSGSHFSDANYLNQRKVKLVNKRVKANKEIRLYYNKALAEMPWRPAAKEAFYQKLKSFLPTNYKNATLYIYVDGVLLDDLIPNFYRNSSVDYDKKRIPTAKKRIPRENIVKKELQYSLDKGLVNSNIALWHSHGWYYEQEFDRWEWQRARLFTMVEDLGPAAFVLPYIVPMLENAGANVLIPRERDWQKHQVIVDNNSVSEGSQFTAPTTATESAPNTGYAYGKPPYHTENPFKLGTFLTIKATKPDSVIYLPNIPETGDYAVYVSYGKGMGNAKYQVHHTGGLTSFVLNQQMGYGTWVYLGKFNFTKGANSRHGKVVLQIIGDNKTVITADAIKFGGGMGAISRNSQVSGRAKFYEGSRYYLQYAGMPNSLVYDFFPDKKDYTDDYVSRGEWVNYLIGKPFGPTHNRKAEGLGIPIDLAMAFHTDAGILGGDSVIGSLTIYSTKKEKGKFPDGLSKMSSRDLTDIVQTEIVSDIRAAYKTDWARRGMWNAQYSEAYRPNVPTMLLELLSQQNYNDITYQLDPHYRFDVSRAIYKGILRFLSVQHGFNYAVQPLPVMEMQAQFTHANNLDISWKPVLDSLEITAKPTGYMVYISTQNNGFNNGTYTKKPTYRLTNLQPNVIYNIKVTAVNAGGEGFPAEVLSAGIANNTKGTVLIVNGFDRVSSPYTFNEQNMSGVMRNIDQGVAYNYDFWTTGNQYDFCKESEWVDDDKPGHGASYGDLETTVFRGNTFDFAKTHGAALLNAGYSFTTVSDEAFENHDFSNQQYALLDILMGEEKTTKLPGNLGTVKYKIYTPGFIASVKKFTEKSTPIFMSGAYVGTELERDSTLAVEVKGILGFKHRTNHAVRKVKFYGVDDGFRLKAEVNTEYRMDLYPVEAPDAIEPANKNGKTVFRYSENNTSAGVAFSNKKYKTVILGFPFEAIVLEQDRNALMNQIIEFVTK